MLHQSRLGRPGHTSIRPVLRHALSRATTHRCWWSETRSSSSELQAPGIPAELQQRAHQANLTWLRRCLREPLREPQSSALVYVLGLQHFSPCQGADDTAALEELFDTIKPTFVALELPPPSSVSSSSAGHVRGRGSSSTAALLTVPLPLQLLVEYAEQLTPPGAQALQLWSGDINGQQDWGAPQLLEALRTSGTPARTGRDLIDPLEACGYYSAADLVTRPQQAALVAQLFNFVPGAAFATAVTLANADGAQVLCMDAPLKLQEAWVQDMIHTFALGEGDFTRQPQRLLAEQQALLAPELGEWDSQLSVLVADAQPDLQVAAFKVSRALAAATLDAAVAAGPVMGRQRALQPLKFRHFERCALHMAQQLRELCVRHGTAAASASGFGAAPTAEATGGADRAGDASAVGGMKRAGLGGASMAPASAANATQDGDISWAELARLEAALGQEPSAAAKPLTVLALVGRQYEPLLRRLWGDPASPVWSGQVQRSFAPSSIAEPDDGPVLDPDTAHGGSRPVGQVVRRL